MSYTYNDHDYSNQAWFQPYPSFQLPSIYQSYFQIDATVALKILHHLINSLDTIDQFNVGDQFVTTFVCPNRSRLPLLLAIAFYFQEVKSWIRFGISYHQLSDISLTSKVEIRKLNFKQLPFNAEVVFYHFNSQLRKIFFILSHVKAPLQTSFPGRIG